MSLIDELELLIDAFDQHHVPYALCGGLALAVHGHARATEDIDVLLPEESLPDAIRAAAGVGFSIETGWIRFNAESAKEQKLYRLLKPLCDHHLILDLFVVTSVMESVWEGRLDVSRAGRRLSVVSSDGLIHMKRQSGRQRDLSDIERLEGRGHD